MVTVSAAAKIRIYKEGVLIGGPTTGGALASITSTNNIRIGNVASGTDRTFDGGISDVRWWNRELTATEAATVANGGEVSNSVHRWKLADDYKDSVGSADGTNSGTYLTNTPANALVADIQSLNLPAATDKLTIEPLEGREKKFKVTATVREGA